MGFRKHRFEGDMDEELSFHLESRIADLIQAGVHPDEARRTALLEFGGIETTKEECRDTRWTRYLEDLVRDIRYSGRILFKSPGFVIAVTLTLALSIGANGAIFSVVNAVLLRPLPYPEPDQLIYVKEDSEHIGLNPYTNGTAYFAWKNRSQSLSRIAAYNWVQANLSGVEQSERINCGQATESFFPLLGTQFSIGRNFRPEEDRPGTEPVAILSHALWTRRFGSERSVLGKTLILDGKSHIIVGILPAGFQVPDRWKSDYDVWVPFAVNQSDPRGMWLTQMRVIGRLKSGVTIDQTQAELDTILQSAVKSRIRRHAVIVSWHEEITGQTRLSLLVFLAAVGLVLLIACVNIASLLLARSTTREREFAVRRALGAGNLCVMRQLLTESLLLALLGGSLGLALTFWGRDVLVALIEDDLPALAPVAIDLRVFGVTAVIALLMGIVFGFAPALQASRVQLCNSLKEGGRGATESPGRLRFRNLLVMAEVAIALVLLIGAGLLLKSFLRVRGIDSGFKSENVLTLTIQLTQSRYPHARDQAAFFQQVIERVNSLTGVQSAALDSCLPLAGVSMTATGVTIEGQPAPDPDRFERISIAAVSGDYFRTMGISLLQGRSFTDSDREGAPGVAVVSKSFVDRYFPNENPLGRRVKTPFHKDIWLTIIGVAGDIRQNGPEIEISPRIYQSYLQAATPYMSLAIRTAGDPNKLVAAIRGEIAAVNKDQPPYDIMLLDQRLADSIRPRRTNMLLVGTAASVCLQLYKSEPKHIE
jgi:putative ABC transport system permease protein